jgi:hypothetical protein
MPCDKEDRTPLVVICHYTQDEGWAFGLCSMRLGDFKPFGANLCHLPADQKVLIVAERDRRP